MMYFEQIDRISRPRDEVYQLVRDRLDQLAPYMPNIERVEIKKRRFNDQLNRHYQTNHWHGKVEIPQIAKRLIDKKLFSWQDRAIWHNQDYSVRYELESFWAHDLYRALGTNSFVALDDNTTELKVACEVTLYPEKVPGIPTFLVRQVLPTIESIIRSVLAPNLTGLAAGIENYFKHHHPQSE